MFRNYLKTAVRSLLRTKGYSFINVAGLMLGLACCLIIFQYVVFEYNFDGFHENGDDLYRVLQAGARGNEDLDLGHAFTGFALGPTLEESVPEIRHVARLHPEYNAAVVSNAAQPDRVFEEARVYYTDPAFLKMFTFPLAHGDAKTALTSGTVLLSESAAEKYFGIGNPIGEMLDWTGATEKTYRVGGVLRDVPANSHLQFDFLLPMHDLLQTENYRNEPEGGWSWNNFGTYVQLQHGADPAAVERKMTETYLTHRGDVLREQGFRGALHVQPLRDVHLNADVTGPLNVVMGSYRTVYFFTVIGLVTLLIALVNYVNLATARALDRAREVGVRKVVGARRRQLIVQFLFEAGLTITAAAALAAILAALLTPLVNDLAGTNLTGSLWTDPVFWAAFLGTLGVATLLAGLYPAFVLSSFRPIAVLKGRSGAFKGRFLLRRGLVVLQFAASVALIGGTTVVYDQLRYMRELDLGLDLEQVLTVTGPRVLPDGTERATAMSTFMQELRRLPGVRQVAASSSLPGQGFNWNGASFRRAAEEPASARRGVVTYIDTSFADLYGLELAAGKGFSDITVSDADDAPWPVIANETAVGALGFPTPAEAIGQPLDIGGYDALVVGVYRDFNWTSAHEARQNIFFGRTDAGRHVSFRASTDELGTTIASVEAIYNRMFPGNVFKYAFLDEAFGRQYRNEERFATLFTLFAGLAVVIACLGLFGLASFTVRQRTKEIGVRKVLGASVPGLVGLLAQDFLKLVVVGVVIALPVAYFLMQRWLEQFAYRVEIDPALFVMVAIASFLIALLTVAYQSIRAAVSDPATSLRVE